MLTIALDDEAEKYLVEILASEKITSKESIHQYWQNLQPQTTFLERRGAHPKYLLNGAADLSDRDVRQQLITEHLQHRQF